MGARPGILSKLDFKTFILRILLLCRLLDLPTVYYIALTDNVPVGISPQNLART